MPPTTAIDAEQPLIIDVDATLVGSHSEKEQREADVQAGVRVPPAVCVRRPRCSRDRGAVADPRCGPGTPARTPPTDHIAVVKAALKQLPGHQPGTRPGRKVLVRVDGAGSTHAFLDWLTGQRLSYSVGFGLPDHTPDLLATIPESVWTPAYDAHDQVRDGAWVAELTDLLDLTGWPKGMRVIARKERPHPGAQLRLTDIDGLRVTAFATNTARGQLPDLELRHRRRARAEDRIRVCKDTGLTNLPLHDFDPEPDLVRHRRCWPPSSPPGCRCSPSPTTTPAGGNRNGSGSGCSPSPPPSPAPADGSCSTSPRKHPGPELARRRPPPAPRPRRPRLTTRSPARHDQHHPGRGTRTPRRHRVKLSHPHTPNQIKAAAPAAATMINNRPTKDPG